MNKRQSRKCGVHASIQALVGFQLLPRDDCSIRVFRSLELHLFGFLYYNLIAALPLTMILLKIQYKTDIFRLVIQLQVKVELKTVLKI